MKSQLEYNNLKKNISNKLQNYFFILRKIILDHKFKKIKTKVQTDHHNRTPMTRMR